MYNKLLNFIDRKSHQFDRWMLFNASRVLVASTTLALVAVTLVYLNGQVR